MQLTAIRTEGLGDTTYLLTHQGVAIVVDPQRDIDRFEAELVAAGADLRLVLETHVHNDYLSGGRSLADHTGAQLVMPAGAAPVFRHRPAFHMEDLDLGPIVVRPIHTPGHTPEHTSYLILVEGKGEAVFTGGSLLVGTAGRTDLLGWDRAETLARLQHGSLRRLAELPDDTAVCPTHGAGSFCTVGTAGRLQSTIGDERRSNTALMHGDEDDFVRSHLSGLPPYPAYYSHMAPLNLKGIDPMPDLESTTITVEDLTGYGNDVAVIDARPQRVFAAGHLPGSVGIELRRDFGVWVGWLVPFGTPLVLVMEPEQDAAPALRQLARIGYDDVRGVIRSLEGWDGELSRFEIADVDEFAAAAASGEQILDTRAPSEWDLGTIDGSALIYVPDVTAESIATLDRSRPVWVACASGFRAAITASLLEKQGLEPIILASSGVHEVLAAMTDND
jgi:glyoxylase-like metal-dependent hydrolase (beta-lactamase superfamily II)